MALVGGGNSAGQDKKVGVAISGDDLLLRLSAKPFNPVGQFEIPRLFLSVEK